MLYQTDFVKQFIRELAKADPKPEKLALYIAGLNDPLIDIDAQLAQLNSISQQIGQQLFHVAPGRKRAEQLVQTLYRDLKFSGDRENYYDPRNSFLDEVLERKLGLPILLSLLYIAIGDRLGLTIHGVGFPGHFMARYEDEAGIWLLDPFNGQVLEKSEVPAYLTRLAAQPVHLTKEMYRPVSAPMLAYRILNNLRHIYIHRQELKKAIAVLNYMVELTPNNSTLWQERGLLHYHLECWESAARDLRRYFFLHKEFLPSFEYMAAPGGSYGGGGYELDGYIAEEVLDDFDDDDEREEYDSDIPSLNIEEQQMLHILQQVEEIRAQIN